MSVDDGEDATPRDDKFFLYEPGVIESLLDRDEFRRILEHFYLSAAEVYGCAITLSVRRLCEAHDFWLEDAKKTLDFNTDEKTTDLDHFKNAALIAYWLRRSVPINDIYFRAPDGTVPSLEPDREVDVNGATATQIQFYRYGNEICALYAGFYIALAYETQAFVLGLGRHVHVDELSEAIGVKEIPSHFRSEFPKLLKMDNLSPHAFYMIYRSLFDQLEWQLDGSADEQG